MGEAESTTDPEATGGLTGVTWLAAAFAAALAERTLFCASTWLSAIQTSCFLVSVS